MKTRVLAVMTILAVMFTAVPAFAGHPHGARRGVYRNYWSVPFDMPPPPPMHRHHYPPMYGPPRVVPHYLPPRPGYWAPGRYYYNDPGLEIGVYRGGFGLHIDF